MATKATQDLWTERVRAWRVSGLDAHAFAAGKGFAGTTLVQRARELGHSTRDVVTLRRVVPPGAGATRTSSAHTSEDAVCVRVGDAEVIVGPGFDAALLRDVVRCLREAST